MLDVFSRQLDELSVLGLRELSRSCKVVDVPSLGWHQRYPEDHRYTPCASLDKLVSEGKIGRKSGEGFHRYSK